MESAPITVSFDGLTRLMSGGTLSAMVESYLICTKSVSLFARADESTAIKASVVNTPAFNPLTEAVYVLSATVTGNAVGADETLYARHAARVLCRGF